jgi:NAD+--dinitrogen-reductase ADP-D-ribosyltransferase
MSEGMWCNNQLLGVSAAVGTALALERATEGASMRDPEPIPSPTPVAHANDMDGAWRRGHSTNFVGVPTKLLASASFNTADFPLHIAGVRQENRGLFSMLETTDTPEEASTIFTNYMAVMFGVHPEQRRPVRAVNGRRRYRSGYDRLLRGWAYDSNGPEGAVLKGWVESRFGLIPTFHKDRLTRFSSPSWIHYVEQKMGSRFHNNAIFMQLDLVYEFGQWYLARFEPEKRHFRLYRGVNDFDEHQKVEQIDKRTLIIRLNNLVSFTAERDIASSFGDYILSTHVPASKVLYFRDLLYDINLQGEAEVIAIGGDYMVKATYF